MADTTDTSESDSEAPQAPKRQSGKRPKKRHFHGNRHTKAKSQDAAVPSTSAAQEPSEEVQVGRTTRSSSRMRALTSEQPSRVRTPTPTPTPTQAEPEPCTPSTSAAPTTSPDSASRRKLRTSLNPVVVEERKEWSGFRVVDIDLFLRAIENNCVCKVCFNSVVITETSQAGWSSKYTVKCSNTKCGFEDSFRSSEMISDRISEVNRRSVYAFKSLGLGYSSFKEFNALMDFPKPIAHTTFDRAIDSISEASTKVAEDSMTQAAAEEATATGKQNITVSGDGSWQKRGFSSLFGVVTLIGLLTGKVIDFLVLSLLCKVCDAYKGEKEGPEFEEWQEQHASECTKNHEGSSGKMEVDGMVQLFKRSEERRGVIYENYIGDGDSKTYKAIAESDPYKEKKVAVKKRECTAHVQKRMGTRLRNLKKELSGKKLSDGKSISGKGRLTDKMINQISEYYGKAIRSSKTVAEMKNKVWAIYYHMSSSDAKPTHQFCPKGEDSWCKYQRAVTAKTLKKFKHKQGVPLACMEACKKVFSDLTSDELLERCIGGYTQNPNESVNNLVWLGCPKVRFFGKKTVDIAAAEGILQFNDGCRSKIKVLREMGVQPGNSCINWAITEDKSRVLQAQIRAKAATKEARVAHLKKKKLLEQQKEDDSYVPGGH
ncbi:Large tegument protein deneddylase [Frankliniella fusca]|uniref:Large tegument protein deneddylase n=1 Tax=Frankliniella fusca TaxID=407009 RepID=A0AAE1I5M6_9NEOP|nr:Large tegument protein deneddylase [Frankliniella fusca]